MYTPRYTTLLEQRRADVRAQLDAIMPSGDATFVWEIGSGHGHFLNAYAAAHPDQLCLGIDIVGERVERAVKKRDRAKLANLHFIHAEARLFLETLPDDARISTVFLLFPDPWPKLRHNKHRILQPSFLRAVASHAEPECPLYFRTDFTPYFDAARDALEVDPHWKLTQDPWPFEFQTVFQQRAASYHSLVARYMVPVPAGSSAESAPAPREYPDT